jgi:hypothetical protein
VPVPLRDFLRDAQSHGLRANLRLFPDLHLKTYLAATGGDGDDEPANDNKRRTALLLTAQRQGTDSTTLTGQSLLANMLALRS